MPRNTTRGDTRTADSIKKAIDPQSEAALSRTELTEGGKKRLKLIVSNFTLAYKIKKQIINLDKMTRSKVAHREKIAEPDKSATSDLVPHVNSGEVEFDRFTPDLVESALKGYKGPRKLSEIITDKLASIPFGSTTATLAQDGISTAVRLDHDATTTAASLAHDSISKAVRLEHAATSTAAMLALKDDIVPIETKILSDEAVVKTLAQSMARILPPKEQLAWTAHAFGTAIAEPAFHMVGEVSPVFKIFKYMKDVHDLRLEASKLRKKIEEIKPSLDRALEEHESLTQKLSKELQAELSKIFKVTGSIPSIIHPLPRINAEDRYTVERYISMRFRLKFEKRGDALKFLKNGQGKNLAAMSANEIAYVLGLLDPDEDKSNIQSLTLVLKNEIQKFEKVIRDKKDIADTTKEKLIDMYKAMIEQSVTRARLARAIRLFQSKEDIKRKKALVRTGLVFCGAATGVAAIVATFGVAIAPLLVAGHAVAAASSLSSAGLSLGSSALGNFDTMILKDKHEASLRHDPLENITSLLESSFVKKIKENDAQITESIVNLNIMIAYFIETKSDVKHQLDGFEGSVGNAQFTHQNMQILDKLIDRLTKYRDTLTLESRELYVGLLNDDLSINFNNYESNLERLDIFNRVMKDSIRELLEQSSPLVQQVKNIVGLEYQAYASYEGDQSTISHEKKIKEFQDKLPAQQAILDEMEKNILGTLERAEKREVEFKISEQTDLPEKKFAGLKEGEFNVLDEAKPLAKTESPKHGRRSRQLGEKTESLVRRPVLSSGRSVPDVHDSVEERSALPGMPSDLEQATDVADHTIDKGPTSKK